MKNKTEKTTITVSTRPGFNQQGWFDEKCRRILEELSFLADILHRPGDEPSGGWPTKDEEIDFHLTYPGGEERIKDRLHIRRNGAQLHGEGH